MEANTPISRALSSLRRSAFGRPSFPFSQWRMRLHHETRLHGLRYWPAGVNERDAACRLPALQCAVPLTHHGHASSLRGQAVAIWRLCVVGTCAPEPTFASPPAVTRQSPLCCQSSRICCSRLWLRHARCSTRPALTPSTSRRGVAVCLPPNCLGVVGEGGGLLPVCGIWALDLQTPAISPPPPPPPPPRTYPVAAGGPCCAVASPPCQPANSKRTRWVGWGYGGVGRAGGQGGREGQTARGHGGVRCAARRPRCSGV
jgi:hypothetical protein